MRNVCNFAIASIGAAFCTLAPAAESERVADPKAIFAGAVAAWHFGDLNSEDGASPLQARDGAKAGVPLSGGDREASIARGGDGKIAEIDGGFFDAGQGGGGRLNLTGSAMTMLLRLRNPSGQWSSGELFCKHGGHDKLVYNLYVNGDQIGFEFGAEGFPRLAGQVSIDAKQLSPGQWHDLIARYDGRELVLFLDGFIAGRTRASGSLRGGNTSPVLIGRRGFRGQIDHAALWARAMSDAEVTALSGGEAALAAKRELMAKRIEGKIGREGLTLADQLRGARELRGRLWNDPHRPRYHLMPPDGFWNDINGTIFWKGRYHVFFLGRLAPDRDTILSGKDTDHARETWLHASSRDLVHWLHHPPALVPVFDGSMPRGLYSGDMINDAPEPTIIVHVPGQGTCIYTAEDDDLIRWKPHPRNPVIPITNAPPEAIIFDPCGWREGDTYYALVGNKNKTQGFEGDSTSLFRSKDLSAWTYVGPFYKSERRWTVEGEDCACPDFFAIGDRHMLLMHTHRPYGQCQYYIGRYEKERFYPEIHGRMSWPGGQICAPETLLDDKGRRIFWGWIREQGPATNGWGSVASLPRVLSLAADKTLRIEPAPELETLRQNHRRLSNIAIAGNTEVPLDEVRGDCLELTVTFDPGSAAAFGVKVRRSPDGAEETAVVCAPAEKALYVDFSKSAPNEPVRYPAMDSRYARDHGIPESEWFTMRQSAPFELATGEPLTLRIFLDRSVLEVFANGRQCITQRIYPSRADSVGVSLFARGGEAAIRSFEAWDISPVNSW